MTDTLQAQPSQEATLHPNAHLFPATRSFSGLNRPGRVESDILSLEVEGTIPLELAGVLYRCGPDPAFPPRSGDDIYINGDGMVAMFVIADGHVDVRTRYVRTDKLKAERQARRALFGAYRNPWTDDPSVAGVDRTTANTSMIWHANKLFAVKEDGLAHQLDPLTLATLGKHDFGGRLRSRTMTAHPKIDPVTGEWVFFGYGAGGEMTSDIAVCAAGSNGRLAGEQWLLPPYASMIHDWAVTQEHTVLPVMPVTTDLDRVMSGGPRWTWDPEETTHLGVLPRGGTAADIVYFDGPALWSFHTMNAFTQGSRVHMDLCVSEVAPMPDKYGSAFDPTRTRQYLTRWTADLSRPGSAFEQERLWDGMHVDFPEIDQRFQTRDYRHGFMAGRDVARTSNEDIAKGVWFNTLAHIDHRTGEVETCYIGDDANIQEPVFVPRSDDAPEGDGWLLALINRFPSARSELAIYDTARLSDGPVATVHIPLHIRPTFHGLWVSVEELGRLPDLSA
jgi:carotenoid cleavage dioxygenase-like enzyme